MYAGLGVMKVAEEICNRKEVRVVRVVTDYQATLQ